MPAECVRSDGAPCAAIPNDAELTSPPSKWPDCFKEQPLKSFLSKVLKGTRCRLTDEPPQSVLTESFEVKVDALDSAATAERVRDALGWQVIKGFALLEATKGVYVARPRWWNEHSASNMWVDLTPRAEGHAKMVLVESTVTPEEAAAAAAARAKPKPARASAPSGGAAVDVSDAASALSPGSGGQATGVGTPSPFDGFDGFDGRPSAPTSSSSAPRSKSSRAGSGPSHPLVGLWRSQDMIRYVPYGEKKFDGYQPTKKTLFPGKCADVRLVLHEDFTFDLEARRWGKGYDGKREPASEFQPRREPELGAPLEYGDVDACCLRVHGTWLLTQFHELHFLIKSVDEESNGGPPNGDAPSPPITKKDIQYAAGLSLGRPIKAPLDDKTHRSSMSLTLNEYLKHSCMLVHDDHAAV
jgi:hypothetical protein